jgi:hypothetical protein
LAKKLKALKLDLNKWNEKVSGIDKKRKKAHLIELQGIDVNAEERSLLAEIATELERTSLLQEVSSRQKNINRGLFG